MHAAAKMFLSIQHCQLLKILIYCNLNFNLTDAFEEALRLEKRAVETSNLEDDCYEQNSENCRQVLRKIFKAADCSREKFWKKQRKDHKVITRIN